MSPSTNGWGEHRAKKNNLVHDRNWPQDLQGMIDVCWVDEAHCIKRADSHASVAIQWLAAEFTGLSTATPAINRIEDWRGYLRFIKPREDSRVQEIWEIDATVNPYGLPKEHPGANLRLTEQAAEKWIF